jgi:hypothetical protein
MMVGVALVLTLVILAGIPFGKFAASRKGAVEAQIAPSSPNRPGDENLGNAQQTSQSRAQSGATSLAHSAASGVKTSARNSAVKSRQRDDFPQTSSKPRGLSASPSANLELAVQHQFKEATLSVWIDNKLTLTQPLHGNIRKHLIVFNGVHGANSETVQVPAGTHLIRLRAQSADQSIDLAKTISLAFTGGDNKTLQVTFNKRNTAMNLTWQ